MPARPPAPNHALLRSAAALDCSIELGYGRVLAAIYHQAVSDDPVCSLRDEEGDAVSDFVRPPQAAHRDGFLDGSDTCWIARSQPLPLASRFVHAARRHHVDPDAVLGQGSRQRLPGCYEG